MTTRNSQSGDGVSRISQSNCVKDERQREIRSSGSVFLACLREIARNTIHSAESATRRRRFLYLNEVARNTTGNVKFAVWTQHFPHLNEVARNADGNATSTVWRRRLSYFSAKMREILETTGNPQSGGGVSRSSQ